MLTVFSFAARYQNAKTLNARTIADRPRLNQRPEVVEDFLRNFLLRNGMHQTLSSFQTEWYALVQSGKVSEEDSAEVPDCYIRNNKLIEDMDLHRAERERLSAEVAKLKRAASKHKKERDYHRLAHRRVKDEWPVRAAPPIACGDRDRETSHWTVEPSARSQ